MRRPMLIFANDRTEIATKGIVQAGDRQLNQSAGHCSKSDDGSFDSEMIAFNVPRRTGLWLGTTTVVVDPDVCFCMMM